MHRSSQREKSKKLFRKRAMNVLLAYFYSVILALFFGKYSTIENLWVCMVRIVIVKGLLNRHIGTWYDRKRRHSALGNLTNEEF